VPAIVAPRIGREFVAGQTIRFKGNAVDAEEGRLPPRAMKWNVALVRGGQVIESPMRDLSGVRGGAIRVPRAATLSPGDVYRITLTAADAGGATASVTRDVSPRVVHLSVEANVAGIGFQLDGQPVSGGAFDAVAGTRHTLSADAVQVVDGVSYSFRNWSRSRKPEFELVAPRRDRALKLVYDVVMS
jgi:hypothetical protein